MKILVVGGTGPGARADPARLVADATLARQQLGWVPQFPELDTIVAHAWAWEQKANHRTAQTIAPGGMIS